MTLLSICIPTYNRAARIEELLESILFTPGDYEICVHDDGSTDDTFSRLKAIQNLVGSQRLRLSSAPNSGRAAALSCAVAMARGRFIMLFDDDDKLWASGLLTILSDCRALLPENIVGYIYHFADSEGLRLGSVFPEVSVNLLALRADFGVAGDKKEVVLAEVLSRAMQPVEQARRVPTSLYWARIALEYDVVCRNVVVGTKSYLPGGMSASIRRLKAESIVPMVQLNRIKLRAFFLGRYRSIPFVIRAFSGLCLYGTRALAMGLRARQR